MCEQGTERIVAKPEWAEHNGDTICIDECIADAVMAAWDAGLVTLGSCCGHGRTLPGLVLEQIFDPAIAWSIMATVDDRNWELFQWQLVTLTPPPGAADGSDYHPNIIAAAEQETLNGHPTN